MPTELMGVVVNDSGIPILPVNNPAGEKSFYELFFQTELGQKLRPYMTAAVNDRVLEITDARQARGFEVTLDYFSKIVEDLFISKDPTLFPPQPEATTTVDNRERNADGRFKSEFQTWSETHSSNECAERARKDADYRSWRQGQYRAESVKDGTFRLAGLPEREAMSDEREQLADFVQAYNRAPSQNIRPRGGFVTLDEAHKYLPQEFEQLLSKSARLGLI